MQLVLSAKWQPQKVSLYFIIFGSIVYNLATVNKRQNFLKVVVHAIIMDQCDQPCDCRKSR